MKKSVLFICMAASMSLLPSIASADDHWGHGWGGHHGHGWGHHHGHHHGHHGHHGPQVNYYYPQPVVRYYAPPPPPTVVYQAPPAVIYQAPPPPPPVAYYPSGRPSTSGMAGGVIGSALGYQFSAGDPLATGVGAAAGSYLGNGFGGY